MRRFRRIAPSDSLKKKVLESATEKNTAYLDRLAKLDYRENRTHGTLRVIGTVAAAVAILTLFTVWALIGRGIRDTEPVEPSEGNAQYIGVKENEWYYVAVDTDGDILSGKEQLQSFFDAYMSGKGCNLDLFVSDKTYTDANGVSQNNGTSYQYKLREDGSGDMEFYNGTYEEDTEYGGMTWYSDAITRLQGYTGEFNVMRFIFLRDTDTYYISTAVGTRRLDMSFIQTSHPNSERIYDSANGDEDAVRFLKMAYSGTEAFYKTEDGTFISSVYTRISAAKDGVTKENLTLEYEDGNIVLKENGNTYLTVLEDVLDKGVLFYSYEIEIENILNSLNYQATLFDDFSGRTQQALTDNLAFKLGEDIIFSDLKVGGKFYRTLVFDSGAKLDIYIQDEQILSTAQLVLSDSETLTIELTDSVISNLNIALMPHSLTDEQAEMLTNVASEYKFSSLPDVNAGDMPYYTQVRHYAYELYGTDEPMPGYKFKAFAKDFFGYTYEGVADDYILPAYTGDGYGSITLTPQRAYITEDDGVTQVYAVYYDGYSKRPIPVCYLSYDGGKTPDMIITAMKESHYSTDEYCSKRIQELEGYLNSREDISEYFIKDFSSPNTTDEFGIDLVEVTADITHTDGSTEKWEKKVLYYIKDETGTYDYIGELEDRNDYLESLITEKYIEYLNKDNTLRDVRITKTQISTEGAKQQRHEDSYYTDPDSGYFQATVKYDVKPKLFHRTEWIAGNGSEEGSWIVDKMDFIYFTYKDGEIVIESSGTGP